MRIKEGPIDDVDEEDEDDFYRIKAASFTGCFRCKSMDHYARDCTSPKQAMAQDIENAVKAATNKPNVEITKQWKEYLAWKESQKQAPIHQRNLKTNSNAKSESKPSTSGTEKSVS